MSSNSYAERVTLNIGGSGKRWDLDGKSKVLELTETLLRSVSEANVVKLEDFVDTVLEHIAEMVEEVSSLRRLVFEVSSCNLIACFSSSLLRGSAWFWKVLFFELVPRLECKTWWW